MKQRHIYFTNRKEYYRRKHISIGMKKSWARRRIIKEQLLPTNTEFIYHAKLIYDSDRDVHHNFMTELKVTIIADEEMPKDKLIDFILDNLPEDYLKTIPFSNVQVGLTSKEKTTASEGSHIEVTKYSHNL